MPDEELLSEPAAEISLTDVTEAGAEELNQPPRKNRKKQLVMFVVLFLLLLLTVAGGWLLWRGKKVSVRTTPQAVEKVTSGRDLQKAAYDSLSGSLPEKTGELTPAAGANPAGTVPPEQTNTASPATAAAPALQTADSVPKVPAPFQPGVALTLAAPPEAGQPGMPKNNPQHNDPQQTTGGQHSSDNPPGAAAHSKPVTDASIPYRLPPVKKQAAQPEQPRTDGQTSVGAADDAVTQQTSIPTRNSALSLPQFGALLPVRLLGMLITLRPGALVRLELVRDIETERMALRRGTIFIGAVTAGELDRAFVQIRGFLDPATQDYIPLAGELLGSDGGAGLRGRRRRVSSLWAQVLDRAAQSGTQILTSLLGRQGSAVIVATDPYGTYRAAAGDGQSSRQNNRSFVAVAAGTMGFVMVTTLPAPTPPASSLVRAETATAPTDGPELSEAELAELLAESDPARIRAALPRLNPELRRLVELTLNETGRKEH